MFYDVESIVLGGGVTRAGAAFLQPILQEWKRQCIASALAQTLLRPAMLHLVEPAQPIGPWGAIAVAEQGLRAQAKPPSLGMAQATLLPLTGTA